MTGAGHAMPRVTVAIPTRNRLEFLRETLASALALDWDDLEVVVSDNCSMDGTGAYLASLADARVRVVTQREPLGMPENWDACLAEASGALFLLLSDDDLVDAPFLRTLAPLLADERVGVAASGLRYIDAAGRAFRTQVPAQARRPAVEAVLDHVGGRYPLTPASTLMRTADVRATGGYAAGGYPRSADAHVWFEVALARGAVAYVGEVLAAYRVHPGALTHATDASVLLEEHARLWERTGAALEAASGGAVTRADVVRMGHRRNLRGIGSGVLRGVRAGGSKRTAVRQLLAARDLRGSPYGLAVLAAAAGRVLLVRRPRSIA